MRDFPEDKYPNNSYCPQRELLADKHDQVFQYKQCFKEDWHQVWVLSVILYIEPITLNLLAIELSLPDKLLSEIST